MTGDRAWKRLIKKLLNSKALNPTWIAERGLRRVLAPKILQYVAHSKYQEQQIWLDVGCGNRPYEALFGHHLYFGVDVPLSGRPSYLKLPDFYYDGIQIPVRDSSIDGILCTQVLEHVKDPTSLVEEMARILRPGGIVIASVPFFFEEHEIPYDFTRFTSYGLENLFANAGFNTLEINRTSGGLEAIGLLASVHFSQNLSLPFTKYGRLIINALICAPIQLLAIGLQKILPDSGRLYLDNVIVIEKRHQKSI